MDRDTQRYTELTAEPAPQPQPSRAGEFTPAASVDMTDEQLMTQVGQLHHDPAAQEQILETLQHREDADRARDAELAAEIDQQRQADTEPDLIEQAHTDENPLTNPTHRLQARRLTAEQAAREEYDSYVVTSYLAAEDVCRGELLNRAGTAAGIDPTSLFSGPASRVRKYASEELRSWFAQNGRYTYRSWRWHALGRDSDRAATATAAQQSTGEAALV